MFSTTDTIVAVATPRGRGALGMVRLSGPESLQILHRLTGRSAAFAPRMATWCRIPALDEVVVTCFRAPASFTGEDVVELSGHGNPVVLDEIVARTVALGARHASPGEFSFRAVLHGRMGLIEAEAVADLIEAETPLQASVAFEQLDGSLTRAIAAVESDLFELEALLEASLDFPDEGYAFIGTGTAAVRLDAASARVQALIEQGRRGVVVREGARVVLAGLRNAGKSTLFNRLVGFDRAIVSDVAGTTRDLLSEVVDLGGVPVCLVDAAGTGATADRIEQEGMARAEGAWDHADLVLVVLDGSVAWGAGEAALLNRIDEGRRLVVVNKVDAAAESGDWPSTALRVSALSGDGVDSLRRELVRRLCGGEVSREAPAVSNARHLRLLEEVRAGLTVVRRAVADQVPEEFVLQELGQVRRVLEELTGRRAPEAVLDEIFARFCIGK